MFERATFVVLVCVGACGAPDEASQSQTACRVDADCPGKFCLDGACRVACTQATTCADDETCQSGICVPRTDVEILSEEPIWLSQHGRATAVVRWQSSKAGTYRFVVGDSCFSGADVGVSGDVSAGQTLETPIDAPWFRSGASQMYVCVSNSDGDFWDQLTIQRDDQGASTQAEPAGGLFLEPFTVSLSCSDNAVAIAYTTQLVDPVFGPDGAVLVGTLYEGQPVSVDRTVELRYRCLDAAGNVEPVRTARYTLVPVIEVELLGASAISNTGPVRDTLFRLTSTLGGTFSVVTSGSCERGAPYGGLGGQGAIAANEPELITIESGALPHVEGVYNLSFCVTEPGGTVNSVGRALELDDTAPVLTAPALPSPLCMPTSLGFGCQGCAGIVYQYGSAPSFDELGLPTSGTAQVDYYSVSLSPSASTLHVVAYDGARNRSAVQTVSYSPSGTAPTLGLVSQDFGLLSNSTTRNTATLVWQTPAGLSYSVRKGSCSQPALPIASLGGATSGTTTTPTTSFSIGATAIANTSTWDGGTIYFCVANGVCPASSTFALRRQDTSRGISEVTLSMQPAKITADPADEPIAAPTSGTALLSIATSNGVFAPIVTLTNLQVPVTDYGQRFVFDAAPWTLPEWGQVRLTFELPNIYDGALNPFPSPLERTVSLTDRAEMFPNESNFSRTADVVHDAATDLFWTACSLGQGSDCVGTATAYTWLDAYKACVALNTSAWGGRSDWRLPRLRELQTLETWNQASTIASIFPPTTATYWTATDLYNDHTRALTVTFDSLSHVTAAKSAQHAARCVSGGDEPTYVYPIRGAWTWDGLFARTSNGSVMLDAVTQLGWEAPLVTGTSALLDAQEHCETLNDAAAGGATMWRIPTHRELAAIARQQYGTRDAGYARLPERPWVYWTSDVGGTGMQLGMDLETTETVELDPTDADVYVRCVTQAP